MSVLWTGHVRALDRTTRAPPLSVLWTGHVRALDRTPRPPPLSVLWTGHVRALERTPRPPPLSVLWTGQRARSLTSEKPGAIQFYSCFSGARYHQSVIGKLANLALSPVKHVLGKRDTLPAYKEAPGPWSVETHQETFIDSQRERKVPVKIYSPAGADDQSSPVVVLSHGLAGNSLTYRYLGRHLASHGYTVLQPTHVGSDTAAVVKRTPYLAFHPDELVHRVEDIRFTLDLVDQQKLPDKVQGRLDQEKVALVGHSFGALTTQAMAGLAVEDAQGQELELEDARIKTFVAMSPYGDSFPSRWLRIQADTYERIEAPILYMSGEHDRIFTLGKGPGVHAEPFKKTASENKAQLTIGGGFHSSFAQVLGKLDGDTSKLAASTTTAFLDAHLHENSEAREYLREDFTRVAKSWNSMAQVAQA